MAAETIREWLLTNDLRLVMSLVGRDPEEQGRMICEKYDFDYDKLAQVYITQGHEAGDANLLNLLNTKSDCE